MNGNIGYKTMNLKFLTFFFVVNIKAKFKAGNSMVAVRENI